MALYFLLSVFLVITLVSDSSSITDTLEAVSAALLLETTPRAHIKGVNVVNRCQ